MTLTDTLTGRCQWWVECCDVLDGLRAMPCESVHCVVTSVPYYGLRDYGTGTWEGGDPDCEHKKNGGRSHIDKTSTLKSPHANTNHAQEGYRGGECGRCGAVRQLVRGL